MIKRNKRYLKCHSIFQGHEIPEYIPGVLVNYFHFFSFSFFVRTSKWNANVPYVFGCLLHGLKQIFSLETLSSHNKLIADTCTQWEFEHVKYKLMFGTSCHSYCECTNNGPNKYYWKKHNCPTGKLCSGIYGPSTVCANSANVQCTDSKYFWMLGKYVQCPILTTHIE